MKGLHIVAGLAGTLAAGLAFASGRITIVSEHEAGKAWMHAPDQPRVVAGYPDAAPDKSRDVCVNLGYLIDDKGATSNFTEMKSWSSATPKGEPPPEQIQPYVQVAAAVASRWRFVPAGGGRPKQIFTSTTFVFDGSKSLGEPAIGAHCRIRDLPAFVARGAAEPRRGDYDRRREQSTRQGMGEQRY